jgi:hypothetical protein
MSEYEYLANKYYSKYQTLVNQRQHGGRKLQKPKKKTAKEKRRQAEAKQVRMGRYLPPDRRILKPSSSTDDEFTEDIPQYWSDAKQARVSSRSYQVDPDLHEMGVPGRSGRSTIISKDLANQVWSDTEPDVPKTSSHGRHIQIQDSDIQYKQDNGECVRPSGNRPMWTEYVHSGSLDGPSPKCPGNVTYPDHRYLHYVDGRYCCTDRPTSPLEACSHLQDRIIPEFDNVDPDSREVPRHRAAAQQYQPYCDYVLSHPEEYRG